ncbi:MAG TPA: SDR family oxidoreductase [Thermoanaerobaculia bacterium]
MIVIVGGTGTMGRLTTRKLLAAGERVTVVTRDPARAESLRQAGAEIVRGDLLDRTSLLRACEGAGTVLSAAHSLFGRGRHASVHVDGRGQRDLIDAAAKSGVQHFVLTSAFDFGAAYQEVPFFRIKYETEEYLRASGLSHTILRPTAFMDPHAHTLLGLRVATGQRVVSFGDGSARRNFIAPEDVARVAVAVIRDPALGGGIVDIGGPENLDDREVIRIYERLSGRTASVIRVPVIALRIASTLFRPLHPGVSQVLRMTAVLQKHDQPFDGGIPTRFGFEPMPLETWARLRLTNRAAGPASQRA